MTREISGAMIKISENSVPIFTIMENRTCHL